MYLKMSLSQSLYPELRRFAPVAFLWNSLLPVKRNILKPNSLSSLYKLKLAGKAGAAAKSTQLSKEVSLKISNLQSPKLEKENHNQLKPRNSHIQLLCWEKTILDFDHCDCEVRLPFCVSFILAIEIKKTWHPAKINFQVVITTA